MRNQVLVYHKFWLGQLEQRGVSRVFDTLEQAKDWASKNVGNWQFEPFYSAYEHEELVARGQVQPIAEEV